MMPARAEVETITGYSAHADRERAPRLGDGSSAGRSGAPSWCTARPGPALAMAQMLHEEGVQDVVVPKHGETFPL